MMIDLESQGRDGMQDMPMNSGDTVALAPLNLRLGFIRKVYGILSAQLSLTVAVACLFMYNETVNGFVRTSPNLLFFGMILSFGLLIALGVKRKEHPTNLYLLFAFTLVEAYTIGTVVTFYDQAIVIQAFFLTMATVVSLTVYTFQSKRDYSTSSALLFSCLWILILGGIMQMFIQSPVMELCLAIFGALLFAGFIVVDTHMLIHKLSPEEYILASINLYLDIINLFLEILRILNAAKK